MQNKQVAIVTGASRGIGRSIAHHLASIGYSVAGTATTEKGAEGITDHGKAFSGALSGHVLNVCDAQSVQDFFSQVESDLGAATILVNNAGITQDNIFLRMKDEQWESVIQTNLSSVYRMTKRALKAMLKNKWGRVVNITSVVGFSGNPGQANYCASKAGVVGFTKSLALELAQKNITLNTIAPGFIETDMTDDLSDSQREAILSSVPMRRMGAGEDIAKAVEFLVSDGAGYMTSQTLHVNGGMYLP